MNKVELVALAVEKGADAEAMEALTKAEIEAYIADMDLVEGLEEASLVIAHGKSLYTNRGTLSAGTAVDDSFFSVGGTCERLEDRGVLVSKKEYQKQVDAFVAGGSRD